MSPTHLSLILLSVSLSAAAQLVLKKGMSTPSLQQIMATGGAGEIILRILLSPLVIGGLFIYFLGALVWLLVLSKIDLSQAYPFVVLGFIMTMVLSVVFLSETVTPLRMMGTLVIVGGVVMVSQS
jgi:drug/metabolite transporter (DMT)-like permease